MPRILYLALVAALAAAPAAARQTALFDVTGHGTTVVQAINAHGAVTGEYIRDDGRRAGYVRHPDGSIETFAVDGAQSTSPLAINDLGQVVGYAYRPGFPNSFLRDPDGTITPIEYPGADNTYAVAINASGIVVGSYDIGDHTYGFLRSRNGSYHRFDVTESHRRVYPAAINAAGTIVGMYDSDHNHSHGFVRDAQGHTEVFDGPDVDTTTIPTVISSDGTVAGYYGDMLGRSVGFVRHPDGRIETFQGPGGAPIFYISGITDRGVVAGNTFDDSFKRKPDGSMTVFAIKRRGSGKWETSLDGINNSGTVTGGYAKAKNDGTFFSQGFVRQP